MHVNRTSAVGGLWSAAVLAVSAIYYSRYFNSGFNFADDGNYAQICYELFLGRSLSDIAINYGVLWFKVGQGLFQIFGVD